MLVQRFSTDRLLRTLGRAALSAVLATTVLATTTLVPGSTAHAQAAPALSGAARWADSVRVSVERATISDDSAGLEAVVAMAKRALTAFPDDPLLLHYQGYALYRQAQRLLGAGEVSDEAEALFKDAIDLFQRSAAVQPMAETYALMSSAMGTLAGTGMVAGMRWGMPAGSAEDKALELGSNNPRVLLLSGISNWYKPSMWGGGEDKGYDLLQRALKAFERDTPAAPLPAWGHAEAYAWLGQMERTRGNIPAARAAYTRALEIAPDYRWVRQVLLPALPGSDG